MSVSSVAERWVEEVAGLTQPARVVWCDGSKPEYDTLIEAMLGDGTLLSLNPRTYPNSYLHRSHPSDVARTEQLTFISTREREDAGPDQQLDGAGRGQEPGERYLRGAMRGRTMYVIPYLMGPGGSSMSRVGIMVTDSAYVVASMHIMTRVGDVARSAMRSDDDFIAGLHSLGDLSPDRRLILHFPEEKLIWSVGSGYGGNALLGKKCHALRVGLLAGARGGVARRAHADHRRRGPRGPDHLPGRRHAERVGQDQPRHGRLAAAGLARVDGGRRHRLDARGHDRSAPRDQSRARLLRRGAEHEPQDQSQRHRDGPLEHDLHQRGADAGARALVGRPHAREAPRGLEDWQGRPWDPASGPAAHPNSRFTVPVHQCPSVSPNWEDPQGVPISGLIFGSRRSQVIPLVFEAFDWNHGVFLGSAMSTETHRGHHRQGRRRASRSHGDAPVLRLQHGRLLRRTGSSMQPRLSKPPTLFRVNWFRRDADGKFLWPGYGENVRVLKWMVERIRGGGQAQETPVGFVPAPGALDLGGLDVTPAQMQAALRCDAGEWLTALQDLDEFYGSFGSRLPAHYRDASSRRRAGSSAPEAPPRPGLSPGRG